MVVRVIRSKFIRHLLMVGFILGPLWSSLVALPSTEISAQTANDWDGFEMSAAQWVKLLGVNECTRSTISLLTCLEVLNFFSHRLGLATHWEADGSCPDIVAGDRSALMAREEIEPVKRVRRLNSDYVKLNQNFQPRFRCENKYLQNVLQDRVWGKLPAAEFGQTVAEALTYGLTVLDPHARVNLAAQTQQQVQSQYSGYGMGATMISHKDGLLIFEVGEDSPAERAGLSRGDIIVSTQGIALGSLESKRRLESLKAQPENKFWNLEILRNGRLQPLKVDLDEFTMQSVSFKAFGVSGRKVGYLRLRAFSERMSLIAKSYLEENAGLPFIIDLRHNFGGLEPETFSLLEGLLPQGSVLKRVTNVPGLAPSGFVNNLRFFGFFDSTKALWTGETLMRSFRAMDSGFVSHSPLVVLVDGFSASAAESVSGALQDYGRAWIVGETTFGKGSIQDGHPYAAGRVMLHVFRTQNYFLRPLGGGIHMHGVTPDFEVASELAIEESVSERDLIPRFSPLREEPREAKVAQSKREIPRSLRDCLAWQNADSMIHAQSDRQLEFALRLSYCQSERTER